ncbi:hypothetical protein [Lapillicoccus sp.]|uniref:hypothetical protein n=1 Tax=Lapillicoccus sp. TaxID=1909287 RepID=UPI0027BCADF7|nr:hypothetical protein [Actinomycetota bacterium]
MTDQLRSGLIGGLIAAVIWMIITVLVEMSKAAIVGGGLALLVGTMLISTAISTIISKRAGARTH